MIKASFLTWKPCLTCFMSHPQGALSQSTPLHMLFPSFFYNSLLFLSPPGHDAPVPSDPVQALASLRETLVLFCDGGFFCWRTQIDCRWRTWLRLPALPPIPLVHQQQPWKEGLPLLSTVMVSSLSYPMPIDLFIPHVELYLSVSCQCFVHRRC